MPTQSPSSSRTPSPGHSKTPRSSTLLIRRLVESKLHRPAQLRGLPREIRAAYSGPKGRFSSPAVSFRCTLRW